MPKSDKKRNKPLFLRRFWNIVLEGVWYFIITIIPAAITIFQFLGGDRYMIANLPSWTWLIITIIGLGIAFYISFNKYNQKIKRKRKPIRVNSGNSVKSNVEGSGTSIAIGGSGTSLAIGGNNYAPINQGNNNISSNKQKRPELARLTEIRKKGYLLRNEGGNLSYESQISEWASKFDDWQKEMIIVVSELDKDKGNFMELVGNVPRGSMAYSRIYNPQHHLLLDTFTEKLNRLDKIIEDYLKLPL